MTAPTPVPLPAGWSPNVDAFGDQWASLPEDVKAAALRWSCEILWKLSGRQFGTTELTLAPYIAWPRRGWYDSHRVGLVSAPGGVRVGFGGYGGYSGGFGGGVSSGFGDGSANGYRTFRLPGPVVSVATVVVDGVQLGEDAWTADPDGTLVRTDGQAWPVGQDVYQPRWVVRYTKGRLAPDDANQAAARYALELARAAEVDPKCKLPARVRDVTRQGISMSLGAPDELVNAGLTGVPLVDAWLRAVNPAILGRTGKGGGPMDQAASLWSPAQMRHRVIAIHRPGEL